GCRGDHPGGADLQVGVKDTARKTQPRGQLVLPAAMIVIGIVSVQYGAGLADRLFGQVPPAAVTGLRLWTSALAMVVISGRGFTRSVRDLKKRRAFARSEERRVGKECKARW